MFQGFKHNLLQEIWYLCKELHKDRNSVVYSEGMPATHIYLIQKGEVTVNIPSDIQSKFALEIFLEFNFFQKY